MKNICAAILVLAGATCQAACLAVSSWSRKFAPILATALLVGTCVRAVADEPPGLGDRVVDYCKQHKGKRVGNGSCTILAATALQSAGANLRGPDDPSRGDRGRGSDFNWGELFYILERDGTRSKVTGQIKDVRPGDIIQFTNTTLTGPADDIGTYTMTARNHTAIVAEVEEEDGMVLKIYHQGANGRKRVSRNSLRLNDLQSGRFSIYHPIARTPSRSRQKSPTSDRPVTPDTQNPPLE